MTIQVFHSIILILGTNKLRKNFYFLFIGLGMFVSLTVCTVMYFQFRENIKASYFGTLGSVANMIEQQYPVIYDINKMKQGVLNNEDWFWEMHYKWEEIVNAFGLAYIYYIEKNNDDNYVFIADTYYKREHGSDWLGTNVWKDEITPAGVDDAWETQSICYSPHPSHEEYWGVLVSALLPIVIDSKTVGLIGVDYDISYVNTLEHRVLILLILSFAASLIITSLLALIGSRSVIVSIEEREQIAREANERRQEIENLMSALKTASSSRTAFLSKISSAMSDPINNIIRISSLVSGKEDVSDEIQKHLEVINESGTLLYGVINDIMDILKIEAGELKINNVKYKLPDLIKDITAQYTLLSESTMINYKIEIEEKMPVHLGGDALRLRLICHHLITNAFCYTTKGVISVSFSFKRQKEYIWLIIKVSDTGIGIADHEMDHIFAGYDQIDAVEKFRKGGSGLGLHISKKLVDLMKGTLALNSELGKGSVFTLTVPQKVLADTVIDSETRNRLMSFSYIVK